MLKFMENKNIKLIFFILGTLFILNGIIAMLFSDRGLGTILTLALGITLLLCSASSEHLSTKPLLIIKSILLICFCLLLVGGGLLYIIGGQDNVTYEEDAVIVLGTTVKDNAPTESLKRRLDAAIEYHQANPDALIIVTGGQGIDENDTEAAVMATYLLDAGIPEAAIIKEDRATSTVENFQFSRELLSNDSQICYISNDFHIYRAGVLAKKAGFEDATHYHGSTPWFMIIPNGLRESVVVLKMWFID